MEIPITEKQRALLVSVIDPMDDYLNTELREDEPDEWNGPYTMPRIDGGNLVLADCHANVVADLVDRLGMVVMHYKADADLYMVDETNGARRSVHNLIEKIKAIPILDPDSPDFVIAQLTVLDNA